MRKLLILSLALTILTGCALADAALTDAETAQIEVQSDADTVAALIAELREMNDANQVITDALVAELEAQRISERELTLELLDLLAEQSKPQVSPWSIGAFVLLAGIVAVVAYRRRDKRVVYVLQPGAQPAALLSPGEQWAIEIPQDVRMREVVER